MWNNKVIEAGHVLSALINRENVRSFANNKLKIIMEIKILGSGCSRCKKTFETVKLVIEEDNVKANVEDVTDIAKILDYNIMSMPAIVIDDKVVLNGQVPTAAQVRQNG